MGKPKILMLDIESSFNLIAKFDLKPDWVSHEHILQDWWIHCAAWKFLGQSKVHGKACYKAGQDKAVVKALKKAIESADVIVGHNVDKFDVKKINTRLIYHGLKPLIMPTTVDTLKVARKHFMFTSNRLDFICKYLGEEGKSNSRGLWLKALNNDRKAIDKMLRYCKNDVILAQQVFTKLRPYADTLNMNVFAHVEGKPNCKSCGSNKVQSKGWKYTKTAKYRRYICRQCGVTTRDKNGITYNGR